MKATELRIVFEDDDGKTYVQTIYGNDAGVIGRLIDTVSHHARPPGFPTQKTIGPVVRRATTFRGSYGAINNEFCVDRGPGPSAITLRDLVPEIDGGVHDVTVDVTAVPVKP